MGKYFVNLLDKHFPKNQPLYNIFNRNSVKVSYSCTKYMKTTVNHHNENTFGMKPSVSTPTSNFYWNKEAYSSNGQPQIGEVFYEGILSSNQPNCKGKKYFEIWETSFKGRLYNHNSSFRNKFYKIETELSKELWQMKMKSYTTEIIWKIIMKYLPYKDIRRKCYV